MLDKGHVTTVALFLLVASASSVFRFGHRENENLPLSDSDYYLDMASVFAGVSAAFDRDFLLDAPHHYNRPALPFLAGIVGHVLLKDNFRAAFSVLNIAAAVLVAVLLYRIALRWGWDSSYPWLPGFLFLTAFPQMNWGYHILTDTFGYATAFASLTLGMSVIDRMRLKPDQRVWKFIPLLFALFLLQSIAFLTRETGWFVVVGLAVYLALPGTARGIRISLIATVLGVVLAAKSLHLAYSIANDLHGPPVRVDVGALEPWYLVDFLVKSAVAFHVCWIAVFVFLLARHRPPLPPFVLAWAGAAVLYIAAGFLHNRHSGIGYPLRMTFALFPLVYLLAGWLVDISPIFRRSSRRVGVLCVSLVIISVVGIVLDQEQGRIRVYDLIQRLAVL